MNNFEMMDLSKEDLILSEVLDVIEEGNLDEQSIEKITETLNKVNGKIEGNNDCKFLKLRLDMIRSIVLSHQEINNECNVSEEFERSAFKSLEDAIFNLDEWLREIENEVDDLRSKVTKKPEIFFNEIQNLLEEVSFIQRMSLTLVHELNVSLICSRNTKRVFEELAEIRERIVNSLGILFEIKTKNRSEPKARPRSQTDVLSVSDGKMPLSLDFAVYSSKWKDNINVVSNILKKFSATPGSFERIKGQTVDADINMSVDLWKKIDSRVDHLILCINCDFVLNYQEELNILRDALSDVEKLPSENNEDQQCQLNSVKEKLKKLQNLIEDPNAHSLEESHQKGEFINRIAENKNFTIENFLDDINKRHEYFSSFSCDAEDDFLSIILSLNDTVSPGEVEERNSSNEKLNQYLSLVECYRHLRNMMEIYVYDDGVIVINDQTNIDEDIDKIKKVMLELLTTISLLETFNESFPMECFSEKNRFDKTERLSAMTLIYDSLKKMVLIEETHERCLLLDERVCALISCVEEKISDAENVTSTINNWTDESIKKTQHQAYWLINICHFYLEKFHYVYLNSNLERLVSVVNSLHVEECNFMKNSYFCKETTREYWFSMLQDWQERVEFQLTREADFTCSDLQDQEWRTFQACMYLVCEFNQIDSNIDLYGVEFEPVFMEYLVSYRSELDKSNKRFIDNLLEYKVPINKFLRYISEEINYLTNQRSKELKVVESIEQIQRLTQTSIQISEYIDSLLHKIDDSFFEKTPTAEEQIRNVRTSLHRYKKGLLLQQNQFAKVFEELRSTSEILDQAQSSVIYVEVLIEQEISTMLSEAILVMINRAKETLRSIEDNQNEVSLKLQVILNDAVNQNRPIMKSIEKLQMRNVKIKEEMNVISKKIQRLNQVITVIAYEEDLTHLHKNNIRIFLLKIDIFSSLKVDSITSLEMGEHYTANIDKLLLAVKEHMEMVHTIQLINSEVVDKNRFYDSSLLKTLFKNEINYFKNSFERIHRLVSLKDEIVRRLELLSKIENNYLGSLEKMKRIKTLIFPEQPFHDSRVSRECESLRSDIDQFLIFIHQNFKYLNPEQKDGLVRDLEQMETLLDVYDHFIDQRSKKQMTERDQASAFMEKNNQIFIDVENFNRALNECWTRYCKTQDDKMLIETSNALLLGIVHTKTRTLNDCEEMIAQRLQESEVFQLHRDCLKTIEKSIDKCKGYSVQLLLLKYGLSYDFEEVFREICLQLSLNVKLITEGESEDGYCKNIYVSETNQILLQIWKHFLIGCSNFAITPKENLKISMCEDLLTEISTLINEVLGINMKINAKITNFRFISSSLISFSERLNTYSVVVQSLSEDCSIQKHHIMKSQSHFYKDLITHHKNQYQLCEKLCDSIMEEEIVGFEIDEEVQNQFNRLTKDMKELNSKHSSSVVELEKSLCEWDKVIEAQSVTHEQIYLLDEYMSEMTQLKRKDGLLAQLYVEKLDIIMKGLDEVLVKNSMRKFKIGSSSDQRFLMQHMGLAMCCLTVCQMVTNKQRDNFENILNEFFGLRKEYEAIKLDTINSIDELHCLYFETSLTFGEKFEFLKKISKDLTEIEKTSSVWHSRYSGIEPSFTSCYTFHLNKSLENLQNWIQRCWRTFDGVHESYKEFGSLSKRFNIRLNIGQEYMEIAERCHTMTTNIVSKYHMFNTHEIRSCLKITELLMEQLEGVEEQLKGLEILKCNLRQLMFGQTEFLEEQIVSETAKVCDLKEVLDLISTSQCSIKTRLLDIIEEKESRNSNLITSYSCYEDRSNTYDKCISPSGLVDSFETSWSRDEVALKTECIAQIKVIPKSSIDELVTKNIDELTSIYIKLISAINDQENFLNDRWNEEIEKSSKNEVLHEKNIITQIGNFCTSTPSNVEPKSVDFQSWFPDLKDGECQTLNDQESKTVLPQLLLLSNDNVDSTVSCPPMNISGFTGSGITDFENISSNKSEENKDHRAIEDAEYFQDDSNEGHASEVSSPSFEIINENVGVDKMTEMETTNDGWVNHNDDKPYQSTVDPTHVEDIKLHIIEHNQEGIKEYSNNRTSNIEDLRTEDSRSPSYVVCDYEDVPQTSENKVMFHENTNSDLDDNLVNLKGRMVLVDDKEILDENIKKIDEENEVSHENVFNLTNFNDDLQGEKHCFDKDVVEASISGIVDRIEEIVPLPREKELIKELEVADNPSRFVDHIEEIVHLPRDKELIKELVVADNPSRFVDHIEEVENFAGIPYKFQCPSKVDNKTFANDTEGREDFDDIHFTDIRGVSNTNERERIFVSMENVEEELFDLIHSDKKVDRKDLKDTDNRDNENKKESNEEFSDEYVEEKNALSESESEKNSDMNSLRGKVINEVNDPLENQSEEDSSTNLNDSLHKTAEGITNVDEPKEEGGYYIFKKSEIKNGVFGNTSFLECDDELSISTTDEISDEKGYADEGEPATKEEWENIFETFSEENYKQKIEQRRLNEGLLYEGTSKKIETLTRVETKDGVHLCSSSLSWLKLFIIFIFLAFFAIFIFLTNLSLMHSCDVYYIHSLRNINPFYVQRCNVPV